MNRSHKLCGAGTRAGKKQRPFMAVAPVQTDKTSAAMAELKREIEAIRELGVGAVVPLDADGNPVSSDVRPAGE